MRAHKEGRSAKQSRPSPLLASVLSASSFLALLLFSSSQELVRDPPYGVRGPAYRPTYRVRDPAYRIRHSAYRSRRGCFEDDNFVLLHTGYRSAGGLRHPATHASHRFLCGPQGFFVLPEGHAEQLAALPIGECDEPLEPAHLPELGQGLLLYMAGGVVHPVWKTLYRGQSGVHILAPSSRLSSSGAYAYSYYF